MPFTATLATEATKCTADGTSMTFVNERRIARDAQGRLCQERWYLVPKGSNAKSSMNWIQIEDPEQSTLYNCSTEKHVCDLVVWDFARNLAAANPPKGHSGSMPDGEGNVVWEELGARNIAGVDTVGSREITTLNAGTMGNDQPLTSMREYWHSDQLGINLLSIRTSPEFGKQTFTITEITLGDPETHLFRVPAGYKVNDQRKDTRISH
jgi:phage terminase large subunit-like protein